MSMTRRNLVRNLAALSALPLVAEIEGACHSSTTEKPLTPEVPAGNPISSSIFVLFEGPWIFDQPDIKSPTLRVTTFGHLDKPWSANHHCPVGLGTSGSSDLANIPFPTDLKPISLPMEFDAGEQWSITAATAETGYSPKQTLLTTIFDIPYKGDAFVYIKGSNMAVSPHSKDRVVTLPMPDAAYAGAYLQNVNITGTNIASGATAISNPYVTVILEYQNKGTPPALILSPSGRPKTGLTAGQHLVFRMIHNDIMTSAQHLHAAHETLMRRIGSWDSENGDGTGLDLTLKILPGSGGGTSGFMATPGSNRAGFDPLEMGLDPLITGGTGYGDCCGGSIVFGG
jgi:hypothetical protein